MRWLETFPSTNGRIAMTLVLAAFYVVWTMVSSSVGKAPPEPVLYIVGTFIAVLGGFDVTQFVAKRRTAIVTPPETMASNAEAVTVAEAPAPTTPRAVSPAALKEPGSRTLDKAAHGVKRRASDAPIGPVGAVLEQAPEDAAEVPPEAWS